MSMSVAVAQRGVGFPYDNVLGALAGGDLNLMALAKAIISRESNWNPQAIRPEPKIADSSYGLMQVLLATARIFAPDMTPDDLLHPITNLVIGMSYLRDLVSRYSDLPSMISSYNAGRPRLDLNRAYVNDVLAYYDWFLQNDPVVQGAVTLQPVEGLTVLPSLEVVNEYPATGEPPPAAPADSGMGVGGGVLVLGIIVGAVLLLFGQSQ